jgi:signal transduction histidine kinase
LTFDLSPPILYDLGLNAALEWISEQFGERHGLAIAVQCDEGVPPPDTETSVLLYRAVRELLTNVVKHAQAREVTIQARYRDGRAQVTVTDNGMGCDSAVLSIPVGAGSLGFGLRHLRERVRYRGGTLMITSSQGAGTSISITLPHTPIRPGGADEDSHHDR